MKNPAKIRIKVTFEQEDSQLVSHEQTLELLDSEIKSLDSCEGHLLQVSYDAMRGALTKQFSELSKKKKM